jgi:hypothetical protein
MPLNADFFAQVGVVIFSLLAGGFWAKSAAVQIPNITENTTWAGTGAFPDALQAQARWNKWAAVCATVAAIIQALSFLVKMPL